MATIRRWWGVELDEVSSREKLVSALGGLVSIAVLTWTTRSMVGAEHAPLVVASMGASAVLLFAVPHGQLSQPWPVLAGHVVAATIGVSCQRFVPSPVWAAGLAAVVMLTIAVVFNAPFRWRRYPSALAHTHRPAPEDPPHEAVVAALRSLDSFIDVSEDDLLELYRVVSEQMRTTPGGPTIPQPGTARRATAG